MASGCRRLEWVTLEPDTGQLEVISCWVAQLLAHPPTETIFATHFYCFFINFLSHGGIYCYSH